MVNPIYASVEHQLYLEDYMTLMITFVKDVSPETKYKNFIEVVELIID